MPPVTRKFSDIDLNFLPHPVTGDITILRDRAAVRRSLRNLLFMGNYDRPFEPDLGANLKQLLFEPINPMTEKALDMQIRGAIQRYEPRISIISLIVTAKADDNGYAVTLSFAIDSLSIVDQIDQFLEKLR